MPLSVGVFLSVFGCSRSDRRRYALNGFPLSLFIISAAVSAVPYAVAVIYVNVYGLLLFIFGVLFFACSNNTSKSNDGAFGVSGIVAA